MADRLSYLTYLVTASNLRAQEEKRKYEQQQVKYTKRVDEQNYQVEVELKNKNNQILDPNDKLNKLIEVIRDQNKQIEELKAENKKLKNLLQQVDAPYRRTHSIALYKR